MSIMGISAALDGLRGERPIEDGMWGARAKSDVVLSDPLQLTQVPQRRLLCVSSRSDALFERKCKGPHGLLAH